MRAVYIKDADRFPVLKERWDKLAKQHPDRFQVVYSLDKPPYFWRGEKGYITKDMIQKYIPQSNAKDVKVRGGFLRVESEAPTLTFGNLLLFSSSSSSVDRA